LATKAIVTILAKTVTAIDQGNLEEFGLTPVFGNFGVTNALGVTDGAGIGVGVTTAIGVGVGVGVGVGFGVGVGVGVTMGVAQVGRLTEFTSRVTAPLRERTRPLTDDPVVAVIEVKAKIVPVKLEFVPSVAEDPTCQNTLQAWAPLTKLTELPEAVVSAEPI
jgi:hypothetical protein